MHVAVRAVARAAATSFLALSALAAQARKPAALKPDPSMIVTTDWLAANSGDRSVAVVVIAASDSAYRAGHIPGSRLVLYQWLSETVNNVHTELPTPDSIAALFESAGVSNASHVVLTGPPLMVTRAFYTLTYLGLQHVSALDGGFTKWKSEGRPQETTPSSTARGHITPAPHTEIIAKAGWVLARAGKRGYSFIDTRTDSEYLGIGARGGLMSTGHIDGARRLEWQDAFNDQNEFSPKSIAELSRMWNERVTPGDTVVTYCYVGYRASGSWFISRLLGYPAKLYDGSYDEWALLKYPTVKTVTPLRKP